MPALEELRQNYSNRHQFAKDWKEQGGRVFGYTCETIPEELIYGAGFLPVRIVGDPGRDIVQAWKYYDNYCTPTVAALLEAHLHGDYDYLDGWFMGRGNDAITLLYYNLQAFSEIRPRHMFWMDSPRGLERRHFNWLVDELQRIRIDIENAFALEITDASLVTAIEIYNRNRALLRDVEALRRRTPPLLSGRDAHEIIGAGLFMSKKRHSELLGEFMADVNSQCAVPKNGVRLWLSGSPQHNLDLVKLIEDTGAVIVGDDLTTGGRYVAPDVTPDSLMSPIEALAENILYNRPNPRYFGTTSWADYFEKGVSECNVDGVIFYYIQWEDDLAWHYPDLKMRLDKLGIPSMLFVQQEYRVAAPERLKLRFETFVQSLSK